MTPDEKECLNCGAPIVVDNSKDAFKARFRTFTKYAMYGTAILTLASIFVNVGVPFVLNISVTIILFLVQNSAQEMMMDQNDKK